MIGLIGHGYVGTYVEKYLKRNGFKYLWLTHKDKIPAEVKFLINAAGYTGVPNVDACEIYKDECVNGNILFPLELEKRFDGPIIHISSGCVYTGYDKHFTENDAPNFTFNNASFYSACKGLEQELLKPYLHKSYLFRIRMPFGPDRTQKNLLTKLEAYDKLIDKENSVTQVEDLAEVIGHFIRTKPAYGIYNVTNVGSTTTKKLADALALNKEWMTDEEFKSITKAPRSNCVLSTKKLESVYKMRSVDEAVFDTVKRYK